MKICVQVSKRMALLEGRDAYGYFVVEIPAASLKATEQVALSRYAEPRKKDAGHPPADFYLCDDAELLEIGCADEDRVRYVLEHAVLVESRRDNERAAERARIDAAESADRQKWLRCPIDNYLVFTPTDPIGCRWVLDPQVPNYVALRPRIAEAEQVASQRNQEDVSQDQLIRECQTHNSTLWAEGYGSELLKARIAEQLAWEDILVDEFCEWVVGLYGLQRIPWTGVPYPDGTDLRNGIGECRTPDLALIQALQRSRKLIERHAETLKQWSVVVTVELVTCDYLLEDHEANDGAFIRRNELQFNITTPCGQVGRRHALAEQIPALNPPAGNNPAGRTRHIDIPNPDSSITGN